jgi:hypothetical protein
MLTGSLIVLMMLGMLARKWVILTLSLGKQLESKKRFFAN